ncbi:MAG TPA: hypothetical protein ENG83_12160 [Nitrospirae bacterium]|nr:hypothetical protein BMS3Abin06_02873 [bacterium BMS3Abin06]HDH12929.1 hypothetical protein [Nitrospirota bacterium]HDL19854.1 hypothetical protein [Nitrospirota bacterium]HDZ01659.1 hypothetical protein [Nitrospirota bacterium]
MRKSSSTLYLYSVGNPADFYSDIECAVDIKLIDIVGKSYVTISNLDLRYSSAHAIWVRDGSNNIIVEDNDISFIGGALQGTDAGVPRYGNGIEIWGNADTITVEYCNSTQIFDAGLTNQSNADYDVIQTNITYRYNNVSDSKMGIEIWSQNAGELSNIEVLNNTFSQMGYGWSGTSANIFADSPFYAPDATVNNIVIRDNVFDGAANGLDEVVLIGGGHYKFERNIVRNGETGVEGVWIKKQPPDDYTDPQNPVIGQNPNVEFNYNLVYGNARRGVRIGDSESLHEGTISLYNNVIMNNATEDNPINPFSNLQISQKVGGTLTLKNNIMKGYTTKIRTPDTGITRNLVLDYNSYYRSGGGVMINYFETDYTLSQFSNYQTASCPSPPAPYRDVNSIAQDPLLADDSNNKFYLQLNSPCIDRGTDVLLTQDFEGNPVILPPDIGAYECQMPVWNLSTGVYYNTLQAAYNAAGNNEIIQSQGLIFTEDLNFNLNKSVTLNGGLNCNYSAVNGTTTINGTMTISDGTVTAEGFELE